MFHGKLATRLCDVVGARSRCRRTLRRKPGPSHPRRQPHQRDQCRRQQSDPGGLRVAVGGDVPTVDDQGIVDIAGNVWASGAATAAFDAFGDQVPFRPSTMCTRRSPIMSIRPIRRCTPGSTRSSTQGVPGVVGSDDGALQFDQPVIDDLPVIDLPAHGDLTDTISRSPTWIQTRRGTTSSSCSHHHHHDCAAGNGRAVSFSAPGHCHPLTTP